MKNEQPKQAVRLAALLALAALALGQGPAPPDLWKRQNGVLSPRRTGDSVAIQAPTQKVTAASTNAVLGVRYLCDRAGCTFVLPAATTANKGGMACAINWTNRSGQIAWTLPSATTVTFKGDPFTASVTSGGAKGDGACVQVVDAGEYLFLGGDGTWTGAN